MNTALKIFRFLLALLLVLVATLLVAMQIPSFQTYIARKAVEKLEQKMDGTITFESLKLKPFNALVAKDVTVLDKHPYIDPDGRFAPVDTLFHAGTIVATFSLRSLLDPDGIYLDRAYIRNGVFALALEPGDDNLSRIFGLTPSQKPEAPKEEKEGKAFHIRHVELKNFHYVMVNFQGAARDIARGEAFPQPHGIDWDNMDCLVNVKGRDFRVSGGYISGTADELNILEKSGYHILSMSGRAKVGHGQTLVRDMKMTDLWSRIELPLYSMTYENTASFNDFIAKVRLRGIVKPSMVSFRSISYFAPSLKDMDLLVNLENADVDGYVNDLHIKDAVFHEMHSGVQGSADVILVGIPNAQSMMLDVQARPLRFTTDGIGRFLKGLSPSTNLDLSKWARGMNLSFSGRAHGPMNRLGIQGTVQTPSGSLSADADIRNLMDKWHPLTLGGTVRTDELDLGSILGVSALGPCTMRTTLNAVLGEGDISARIDTLKIDRLTALGYPYSGIAANGTYANDSFNGKLVCNDPNLNFLFQGTASLSPASRNAVYKFYANLGYADLNALQLDKRGTSKMSAQITANYMRADNVDLLGDLDITDLVLEDARGRHQIGNISLSSHANENLKRMVLNADFMDGSFSGSQSITSFIKDIQKLTLCRELPALAGCSDDSWSGEQYRLSLRFHDSRDLLSFIKPGAYIADSTSLTLDIARDGSLKTSLRSPRLALGKTYLRKAKLEADNLHGCINGSLTGSEFALGSLHFQNSAFLLFADDNHLGLGATYDNEKDKTDKGEFYATARFSRDEQDSLAIQAHILPSNVYFDGTGWNISPAVLDYRNNSLTLTEPISATSMNQSISIAGGISPHRRDTLSLKMDHFDIGILGSLTESDFDLRGQATGRALVTSPTQSGMALLMNLRCDSTYIASHPAGNVELSSVWDDESNLFRILCRNELDGRRNIDLRAGFSPKNKSLKADLNLDRFEAGYAAPLLEGVLSTLEGKLSGHIHADGTLDQLNLSSEDLRIDESRLALDFTGVPYHVSGPLHLTSQGVFFDTLTLRDEHQGSGTLDGAFAFSGPDGMAADLHIQLENMEALRTTEKDNSSFYGNVSANGRVSLTGPVNALLLDINASSVGDGSFHIPLSTGASAGKNDLLTFREPAKVVYIDPYEEFLKPAKSKEGGDSDMRIRLNIQANQDIQALIELDKDAGNILSARGNGQIQLDLRPRTNLFQINGDYTLSSGSFNYNALGFTNRLFKIDNGSSIRFSGDLMESDLDIGATYSTKTSVGTLIADTSSVSTRRLVNCHIQITDKLKNPELKFSIDVPDIDPATKTRVESALNTDDKIQKQFLSLLISGSFMPDEQSGIVNNTNLLYSNLAEVMATQLNTILERLDIPLDLGLTYQESAGGTNIFDVAVSTQLFNNRVLVNGTLGNRQKLPTRSGSDVVGDLDIEIKLDRPGQFRLKLFSHSADDYTNYLDYSQRNGVGITWQREFSSFKEFVRDLFSSKRKRAARAASDTTAREQVILEIKP